MGRFLLILFFSVCLIQADTAAMAEILGQAARAGRLETMETLLSSGIDPDLVDQYGKTPLYYAVSFHQTEMVALLLDHHANPNSSSLPLQCAAEQGLLSIVDLLLATEASVNAKAATGRTALQAAASGNHLDVMQRLIEKDADVNARDREGTSPLDETVWRGDLEATAILIARGAHLNEKQTRSGATPINQAADRGHRQIIRYLLLFQPDLTVPDRRGYTPVETAIFRGHSEAALLLLAAAPPEQKTAPFRQKLMNRAITKDDASVMGVLLRDSSLANARLASGDTPLETAASAGATNVVRTLLEQGADPNGKSRNGASPLEEAALRGGEAMAQWLLDHGALVNQINEDSGKTALYVAASFRKASLVKLLLARGADPNLCGNSQSTPYAAALQNGDREMMILLQRQGGSRTCQHQ